MKKLKVGVIGVGRLGYEHACNIANRVPGMEPSWVSKRLIQILQQCAQIPKWKQSQSLQTPLLMWT